MYTPSSGDSQIDALQRVLDRTYEALSRHDPTRGMTPAEDMPSEDEDVEARHS